MAIITNTFTTYSGIGIREQLADVIYNISPTDTPLLSGAKKGTATNTFFEWQTDVLAAAAANAQLDGDDIAAFTAVTPTVRIGNRTQISRKTFIVSGTEEIVNKAGRKSDVAYLIAKAGKELKRDMEFALTQNTTAITGSSGVARQTRGLEGWVGGTNSNLGVGGVAAAPTTNTAPTDGTQRYLSEAMVKDALKQAFVSGGNPDTLMVGPFNKQMVSTFTGNATRMDSDSTDQKLYAAISVYVSDYGSITCIPNRFQRDRTAFALQLDMFTVMYLRPFQVVELAQTGDAQKRMLIAEYGLMVGNEASSAAVRDLLTS